MTDAYVHIPWLDIYLKLMMYLVKLQFQEKIRELKLILLHFFLLIFTFKLEYLFMFSAFRFQNLFLMLCFVHLDSSVNGC